MTLRRCVLYAGLLYGLCVATNAHASCTVVREQHYRCDGNLFAKKLAEAHTIRVDTGRTDLFAADRTGRLVKALGKQVAGPDAHADLTFQVAAVDRSGRIDLGPADTPLARLNVYDTDHQLVWVETLDGQEEIPWTADVIELLKRFQAGIASSSKGG